MDLWLYVYGNGEFIYSILTSVNFFMNNAKSFFQLAAIVSLLLFAFESTGIIPTRGYDWSRFIKVYFLISIFVLTPYPGKVTVSDVITNQNRVFNFTNKQLPFGMIVPIALTSTAVYRLINLYQQNFEIDSNLAYTFSGMNFGANFIQSLDNVDSYDDKFNYNLDQYMQNCGFPLINKAGALSELRRSKDIFTTLSRYTSASRFVKQVDFALGTPTITPCNQAINDINFYYTNHSAKILMDNANRMGISSTGLQYNNFILSANSTSKDLLGISQGASAALKQAIGMNILMSSIKNGAHSAGNGDLALAAYDAEQFQQYKTSSVLSGAASARTIPILVGISFALLFLLYPIMIFLAIAMGSYRAIGVFFQIIVGINLIPLIYEILNYITTYYLRNKLGVVISGQGYNYEISTSLYSFTDNMIIAGNYLASATPIIAYAIVTGSSTALTSVFGHINDPAKAQTGHVGQEMARGNQSIGNASIDTQSYNNMQGNKLDDQLSVNSGVPIMKDTTSGGIHTNVGGQNYDINYKSDLLANPNFAQMATHSIENSLRNSRDQMNQVSKQWGQQSQRLHDLSNSISSGQGTTSAIGTNDANNLRHAQELASHIGTDLSVGGKLGVGIEGDLSMRSSSTDALDHSLSEYKKYASELSHSSNQAVRDAFSETNLLTNTTHHTMQETIAKSQALNDINLNQSSINTNYSNDFDKYLRSQGYDPTQMSASELSNHAQQFVETNINPKYKINNNLQNPSTHLSNNLFSNVHKIDSNGLQQPSIADDSFASNHRATVQAAIDNFSNHQGNIVGNQIAQHGKVISHIVKDVKELGNEFLNKSKDLLSIDSKNQN